MHVHKLMLHIHNTAKPQLSHTVEKYNHIAIDITSDLTEM